MSQPGLPSLLPTPPQVRVYSTVPKPGQKLVDTLLQTETTHMGWPNTLPPVELHLPPSLALAPRWEGRGRKGWYELAKSSQSWRSRVHSLMVVDDRDGAGV